MGSLVLIISSMRHKLLAILFFNIVLAQGSRNLQTIKLSWEGKYSPNSFYMKLMGSYRFNEANGFFFSERNPTLVIMPMDETGSNWRLDLGNNQGYLFIHFYTGKTLINRNRVMLVKNGRYEAVPSIIVEYLNHSGATRGGRHHTLAGSRPIILQDPNHGEPEQNWWTDIGSHSVSSSLSRQSPYYQTYQQHSNQLDMYGYALHAGKINPDDFNRQDRNSGVFRSPTNVRTVSGGLGSIGGVQECSDSCPVNGGWSDWKSVSVTCNILGTSKMERKCNNPKPLNGGEECSGSAEQEAPCLGYVVESIIKKVKSEVSEVTSLLSGVDPSSPVYIPLITIKSTMEYLSSVLSAYSLLLQNKKPSTRVKRQADSECAKINGYFEQIDVAKKNIKSSQIAVHKLKTQTRNATILAFVDKLEPFLSDQAASLVATETQLERDCLITRSSSNQDPGRFCPEIRSPVCGKDGKTYGNSCYADDVGVERDGVCSLSLEQQVLLGPVTECIEADIDFYGEDIKYALAHSGQACACECRKQAGCEVFSWIDKENACWMKTSDKGRRKKIGVYSGSVDCCQVCKTLSGDDCVFPFKYKGNEYEECTDVDSQVLWCATQTDTKGNYVDKMWGRCGNSCKGKGLIQNNWVNLAKDITIRYFSPDKFFHKPAHQSYEDRWKDIWNLMGENITCSVEAGGKKITIKTPPSFHSDKQFKIFTHGFASSVQGKMNEFVNAWMIQYQQTVNVVLVDWPKLASEYAVDGWFFTNSIYDHAARNSIDVGHFLGLCLAELSNKNDIPGDNIHLLGHSLGAHLMGKAGKIFFENKRQLIGRITGLDPAGPRFYWGPLPLPLPPIRVLESNRLTKDSAGFVDIIHTYGSMKPCFVCLTSHLGYLGQMGHIDFYPNGGSSQPGCYIGYDGLYYGGFIGTCSHARSYIYYLHSIMEPTRFPAFDCILNSVPCHMNIFNPIHGLYMGESAGSYKGERKVAYVIINYHRWAMYKYCYLLNWWCYSNAYFGF